jgi:hypothetical protein
MSRQLESIREDIIMLKAWIEHWKVDASHGLLCTRGSLDNALHVANRTLKEIGKAIEDASAIPPQRRSISSPFPMFDAEDRSGECF